MTSRNISLVGQKADIHNGYAIHYELTRYHKVRCEGIDENTVNDARWEGFSDRGSVGLDPTCDQMLLKGAKQMRRREDVDVYSYL